MHQRDALGFGPFQIDLESEQLRQESRAIRLRPKSFAVLRYLAEHPRRLITKDELLQAVWSGIAVSESVLTVCLSELRKALGDQAHSPRYIETVPRRGYRFVGPIGRPAPSASAAPRAEHPLSPRSRVVGREMELARLHGWWEAAERGERWVAFVTGEPGIGKTTLVDVFVAEAAARGEVWTGRGQCIEHYGGGEPYLSVLDALARLCRGPEGERVRTILHQYAPTWLAQMPWFLSADEQAALGRRVLGSTRERMLRELAEAVEALSRERPLLLVLEDLHWADGATVDLLAWLARRREPARLAPHRHVSRRGPVSRRASPRGGQGRVDAAAVLCGASDAVAHRCRCHPVFVSAALPRSDPGCASSGAGFSDSRAHRWPSAVHGHAGRPSGTARMASGRRRAMAGADRDG